MYRASPARARLPTTRTDARRPRHHPRRASVLASLGWHGRRARSTLAVFPFASIPCRVKEARAGVAVGGRRPSSSGIAGLRFTQTIAPALAQGRGIGVPANDGTAGVVVIKRSDAWPRLAISEDRALRVIARTIASFRQCSAPGCPKATGALASGRWPSCERPAAVLFT